MDTPTIKGSCVCGAVQFAIRPPYRFFQYCHCSRCRKRTGSAHAANIAILVDQLVWLAGEDPIRRFELPTAKSGGTAFCTTCGSGLPWLTRNGRAWIVPAGTLDDDPGEKPTRNIHFASRAVWHAIAGELPVFDAETS